MIDNNEVRASFETLMHQAAYTTEVWLSKVVCYIDEQFGEGYAQKNPTLVGEMLQAAALDQQAAYIKLASQDIRDAILALARATETE